MAAPKALAQAALDLLRAADGPLDRQTITSTLARTISGDVRPGNVNAALVSLADKGLVELVADGWVAVKDAA